MSNPTTQAPVTFGKFEGKYADEQKALFEACQTLFGIEESKAHTIAFRFAADYGNAVSQGKVKASIGKVSKKGLSTLTESLKVKGCTLTNPLKIARAVQWAGEAGSNFVSYGFTSWKLADDIQEYVDTL